MTPRVPAADDASPFDPEPIAARVRATLFGYLRERAPGRRLASWKAVARGCGGTFETLAGTDHPRRYRSLKSSHRNELGMGP